MADSSPARSTGAGRWLLVLIITGILTQTSLNLVRPVSTYKLISFDAGAVTVGAVTAAYALLPLFSAMWLGRFSSRLRQIRYLMLAGAVVLAIGGAGLELAPNAFFVAVASAVLGLGHLMFTIGGQSSIARFLPDDQLDKGFGWFTAAYSVGQFLGPLVAGWVLGSGTDPASLQRIGDIRAALWIGAAAAVLAVPFLLLNLQPKHVKAPVSKTGKTQQASLGQIMKIKGMGSHMLASLTLLCMLDILTAFMPLVGEKHNVAPAAVGVLLAIRGVSSVASRLCIPALSRRFERRTLLLASMYTASVTIAAAPLFIDILPLSGAAMLAGGFFLGLGQPMTMTLVSTSVPPQDRGAALAARLVGNRFGQVLLPVVASSVAAGLGPAGAIWFCCGLLAASGVEKTLRRPVGT